MSGKEEGEEEILHKTDKSRDTENEQSVSRSPVNTYTKVIIEVQNISTREGRYELLQPHWNTKRMTTKTSHQHVNPSRVAHIPHNFANPAQSRES